MKVAEMCRKLETEEEKVLPFYASSLTKEEQEDVDAAVLEQPSEPIANVSVYWLIDNDGFQQCYYDALLLL